MAVHVLTVLAYKEGEPVTSDFLARSVNTNPVIIRRLLLTLQEAGLVETRRGAGRGSKLSRSPARINLAEVYRAVEGDECFVLPARRPNRGCPVGHCIQEAISHVFVSAQTALECALGTTRLADLVRGVERACAKKKNRLARSSASKKPLRLA